MFTINDPINNLQLQKKPLDTAVEDFFQTSFNNVDDLLLNIADKHNIPSFNKYLSQIEEIKKIAEECNKTWKKTLLIVRNERLVQYLEKYLDKKQIDNNNNINIQSECFCKKSAEELDSYEFNWFSELRIFDIPRFWSSNWRWTNECNFIKYISKKYPQIKVEFSNFSRKFLDNEVLYKFIEENFDESITIENNNERIQDLIDSDEHWSYKWYQLQLDNDIKSPDKFISHVEDLLIESLEEWYNNKRVILYAENIGQKKRILKKINKSDKLNKGNFKIIISDEIGYHDEWKEEAVLILDPNPSDDKVIKIVRASILNKKNNEIPIITCNNEIPLTSKDWVIRNKSNQSIELENLEDNNVPKTKKKKSNWKWEQILVKRKSIQETLEINWAINSATKITDFNSMTELGLIELVKLELSKQNPPVIDEAILINIWIPKLTIKIPALSELFERRKIRKTKTSITEFSKIFFLQKEKAYYYKKLKWELKKEWINNYLDFIGIPIRKRPRKKNSDKNENIIDWLSLQRLLIKPYFNNYIHTELKLSKITDYWNPHKHITANYLFWDDYLKKSKGTAIKELNHKWVNSGLHLLN